MSILFFKVEKNRCMADRQKSPTVSNLVITTCCFPPLVQHTICSRSQNWGDSLVLENFGVPFSVGAKLGLYLAYRQLKFLFSFRETEK